MGASFQLLSFWSIVVGGDGFFCCFQIWSCSKYREQMILDSHQLSYYYNILP